MKPPPPKKKLGGGSMVRGTRNFFILYFFKTTSWGEAASIHIKSVVTPERQSPFSLEPNRSRQKTLEPKMELPVFRWRGTAQKKMTSNVFNHL